MIANELDNEYFEWMYQLVCNDNCRRRSSYRKLLTYLHNTEFTYIMEMDSNRVEDGIDLRRRFGYECRNGHSMAPFLANHHCSILEVMVALAIRCEEHIMDDPEIGNRTGQWFWGMISSLTLTPFNDQHFNRNMVECIIDRFLNREYAQNGEGGLFTVKRCAHDLRTIEIWYQMCWYLDSIL